MLIYELIKSTYTKHEIGNLILIFKSFCKNMFLFIR